MPNGPQGKEAFSDEVEKVAPTSACARASALVCVRMWRVGVAGACSNHDSAVVTDADQSDSRPEDHCVHKAAHRVRQARPVRSISPGEFE